MLCNVLPFLPKLNRTLKQIKQPAHLPLELEFLFWTLGFSILCQMQWVRKTTC